MIVSIRQYRSHIVFEVVVFSLDIIQHGKHNNTEKS